MLSEPAATRLATAVARRAGCEVTTHHRPSRLGPLLEDLRTYALFSPAKVILAVDTALLADKAAAADLIDEAAEGLPAGAGELGPRQRAAASRLLQALRLFGVDPYAGDPERQLAALPPWALQGGAAKRRRQPRGRGKAEVEALRSDLAALLAAARAAEIQGFAEGDLAELGAVIAAGLPRGHVLVLAERAVAREHPTVVALSENGALVDVGQVAAQRDGGWEGVDDLVSELERQTGASIETDAVRELVRRTLRSERRPAGREGGGADRDSTARFAAEYRKLADIAGGSGARIDREGVEAAVDDRGEEDVWKLLDALAEGRSRDLLDGLARRLRSADDPGAARLMFFQLVATFCRQLSAAGGLLGALDLPRGEANYSRFKDRVAPALQAPLAGGEKNPLAGLHPFRLHRVVLAAARAEPGFLARLPWRVLEAELGLKGESGNPDDVLAGLLLAVAAAVRPASGRPQARPAVARGKPNSSFSRR